MDLKPYPRATSMTSYLPLDIQPDKLHTKIMDLLRHMAATLDTLTWTHISCFPFYNQIIKPARAYSFFFYPVFFRLEITINLFALFLLHTSTQKTSLPLLYTARLSFPPQHVLSLLSSNPRCPTYSHTMMFRNC